jgi:hypothetical protein
MSTRVPCAGKHALFDSTDERDHAEAARFCATCPLIAACRQRLDDMTATAGYYGHPEGTWAGQLMVQPDGVRRLAAVTRSARIEAEEARYTDADARQAHTAYAAGDKSEWARTGHRVFDRRRKRAARNPRDWNDWATRRTA